MPSSPRGLLGLLDPLRLGASAAGVGKISSTSSPERFASAVSLKTCLSRCSWKRPPGLSGLFTSSAMPSVSFAWQFFAVSLVIVRCAISPRGAEKPIEIAI